jgi:hypothetical protein
MSKRKMFYRQGDVGILRVETVPETAVTKSPDPVRGVVLAYGEVTGHAHVVEGTTVEFFTDPATETDFFRVDELCEVTHEEHTKIELEPGVYQVIRQREYTPEGWMQVAD